MRIFKPIYKKNCNWCKFLRYGVITDIAECKKTGEKMSFTSAIQNNKTCKEFKCNDSVRTLWDRIKDFIKRGKKK